jgi:hypothetical protein
MQIGSLFVKLGIKTDNAAIKRFDNNIRGAAVRMAGFGAAFVAAGVALDKFTKGSIDTTVALQNIANRTGLAISKLQQFGQATQLSDLTVTAQQAALEIANLQQKLTEMRTKGTSDEAFITWQIDRSGDAFSVLEKIRERIKGMSKSKAGLAIADLGLSPQMINVLRLSRAEFEKLGKNKFLSEKQRQTILNLGTAFTRLKLRIGALKDQAVAKLAPSLEKLINSGFKWFEQNGNKVIDIMSRMGRALTSFSSAISNAVGLVAGLKFGFEGIAIVLGALAIRFAPIATLVTGLILLLDDIAVHARGGSSAIGLLLDKINELTGIELSAGGLLAGIAAIGIALTMLLGKFRLVSGAAGLLGLGGKGGAIKKLLLAVGLGAGGDALGDALGGTLGDVLSGAGTGAAIGSILGVPGALVGGAIGGAVGGFTSEPPLSQSTINNAQRSNSTQNNNVSVVIDAANANDAAQNFKNIMPGLFNKLQAGVR